MCYCRCIQRLAKAAAHNNNQDTEKFFFSQNSVGPLTLEILHDWLDVVDFTLAIYQYHYQSKD